MICAKFFSIILPFYFFNERSQETLQLAKEQLNGNSVQEKKVIVPTNQHILEFLLFIFIFFFAKRFIKRNLLLKFIQKTLLFIVSFNL